MARTVKPNKYGVITSCPKDVKEAVIPAGVTKIGDSAFHGCESLASVVIPDSVTKIGMWAFQGCEALASVVIPESVTEIGWYAFEGCAALASVEFGGTMAQWDAVLGKDNLFNGDVPATGVKCADGEWQKPVVLVKDGVAVKCLDKSAASVEIPAGVTEIGERAFYGCESLASVVIPDSVTKIGMWAFQGCESLASVVIPESVTEIGGWAFYGCESLAAVEFGGTMAQWDAVKGKVNLFNGNVPATGVKCADGEWQKPVVLVEDGVAVECLDKSAASVEIPAGVTEIGESAFSGCAALAAVVIPESVTKIGDSAFNGCKSLKSISLPSTLEEIGKDAFKGCDAVEIITSASPLFPFNEKTRKLYDATGKTKKVILVANAAKEEAKQEKIEKVQLASAGAVLDSIVQAHPVTNVQVRKEEKECFIAIPAKDGGMELCLANSKVQKWMQTLPVLLDKAANNATAAELREYAKANDLPDASRKYITVSKDGSVKKKKAEPVYLVIPEGVTEIGYEAFEYCESLASVEIPAGVTEIGGYAFVGCSSLSSVVIPSGVTEIGDEAFKRCAALSSVVIGAGVTEIGGRAFDGCTALASVEIPEGVTEIGDEAFRNCTSLSSVVIPSGVTEIGSYAFYGCTALASVEIPEGVTEIGEGAFQDCELLSSVVIPESVTAIGERAFKGCNITELSHPCLTIKGGVAIKDGKVQYCASQAREIVIPEGVTAIGSYAFYGCTALASVVIPESVTAIGMHAFWGCKSLSSVVIPAGVTEIGYNAFDGCSSLSSVVIPSGVTEIGFRAFDGCSSLSSVEFGGTMAQWEAVEKGDFWHEDVPAKSVKCSDGEAKL